MTRHGSTSRWRAGTAALACILAVAAAPPHARAEASIDISATAPPSGFWLGEADIDLEVVNPGTEPLASVVVVATGGDAQVQLGGPWTGALTGPVVVVGDADDVLDPGERWAYSVSGVYSFYGLSTFEARATTPDSGSVVDDARAEYGTRFPLAVTFVADPTTPTAGDTVRWTATATNVADFPVVVVSASDGLTSLDVPAGPIPAAGTERWIVARTAGADGAAIEIELGVRRSDSEIGPVGASFTSERLVVAPTTTGTGSGTMPRTGAGLVATAAAVGTLVLGLALLAGARRPTDG